MKIDISGAEKWKVFQLLFNASKQQGMGLCDPHGVEPLSGSEARLYIKNTLSNGERLCFDYVLGRVMKVDISGDTLDSSLYDRDNGEGAAACALSNVLFRSYAKRAKAFGIELTRHVDESAFEKTVVFRGRIDGRELGYERLADPYTLSVEPRLQDHIVSEIVGKLFDAQRRWILGEGK